MAHLFRKDHLLLSLGLLLGLQIRKEDCGICASDEKRPLIGFQARPSESQTDLEPCGRQQSAEKSTLGLESEVLIADFSLPLLRLCPGLSYILFLSESLE